LVEAPKIIGPTLLESIVIKAIIELAISLFNDTAKAKTVMTTTRARPQKNPTSV
jgi:hypothetical protein